MNTLLFLVIGCVLCFTSAQPAEEEVKSLPGVINPQLSSRQYSGYLSASNTIKLHYWFVESERDPVNDPLVLWMNGGPGCSSLDGYLSELGPYLINPDGTTLTPNPNSWSKVANVIFLEAPAGVGFSYSDDQNYTTSDNETAKNNYLALLDFFAKFPNMAKKPFFITGESYGGFYVPTLSVRVMANASINFQGFAIGNGLLDSVLNTNTAVYYAYYHAIIGEDVWAKLQQYCCKDCKCNFAAPPNQQCQDLAITVQNTMMGIGINPYDVTGDCAGGVPGHSSLQKQHIFLKHFFEPSFLKALKNPKGNGSVSFDSNNIIPCIDAGPQTQYLNTAEVRLALHIPNNVSKWAICSGVVGANYKRQYQTMKDLFNMLLPKHRALVYNGDADMMCNFLGDQKFVASLQQKELGPRRPWIHAKQIAGFVHEYEQITFMTVKNAGHMVPSFTPGAALQMITNFLNNKPQ
ncbi:lysosomal protective protein-like [Asterias amurensis]|uniref:lysosomal protective protein-like n=1 Tax=Asterias amurensis TaxID=7602 RepID=UPI003AB401CF